MLDAIESYVAREHWPAIRTMVGLELGLLTFLFLLLQAPVAAALALVHLITLLGGAVMATLALNRQAKGDPLRAVAFAQRAVSTLIISGLALLGTLLLRG